MSVKDIAEIFQYIFFMSSQSLQAILYSPIFNNLIQYVVWYLSFFSEVILKLCRNKYYYKEETQHG